MGTSVNVKKKREDFCKAIDGISFEFLKKPTIITSEEQLKKMKPEGVQKVHNDLNEYIRSITDIIAKGCEELRNVINKNFKSKIISESYKYLKHVDDAARRALGIIRAEKFSVETSMQSFEGLKGALGLLEQWCVKIYYAEISTLLFEATLDYQPIRDKFEKFADDIKDSVTHIGSAANSIIILKKFEKSLPKS